MSDIQVIETRDGSSSLLIPEMNETYHSTHGAITESEYVFLKMGLDHFREKHKEQKIIRILEIGFGTGLNPWLTTMAVLGQEIDIRFTSIEKYPLAPDLVAQLNYKDQKSGEMSKKLFTKLHQATWEEESQISDQLTLTKVKTDIADFNPDSECFDLIYFDAFAPSKQPEMWSYEVLRKMYDLLTPNGVFVTYCAQGQFKRDLKAVGFETEELDGPPGKKEMTRGTKLI
ncbi:tRNA (5-methylaminomethyl-2-thiouridine)(34)-methyltransferase MnmD [Reichenbachiella carrageenanivorans]|uniref:tRNA (5-methylaminomethyl-2-thiouridine)(34)-methyltransferase MnmD n=1 Tax=Reichenbachiella carrageenanivorans TaxID=2979869 RepID=A0ABY6D2G0_9BACT|nr:tRNA (5-methylaminomethyl-2-thiouridine)(34)-methyltransferase MnmD [Reichenbachiella carrageenanivorans]UXX80350.1 tRNA (5-methylaminomethyl-2-thiouridine)(34)-methyltransferase MnmD [Reichenbachiella carrageenanivorans]